METTPNGFESVGTFGQAWPVVFIAIGFIATSAWGGLIGYGLFRLGELVF